MRSDSSQDADGLSSVVVGAYEDCTIGYTSYLLPRCVYARKRPSSTICPYLRETPWRSGYVDKGSLLSCLSNGGMEHSVVTRVDQHINLAHYFELAHWATLYDTNIG